MALLVFVQILLGPFRFFRGPKGWETQMKFPVAQTVVATSHLRFEMLRLQLRFEILRSETLRLQSRYSGDLKCCDYSCDLRCCDLKCCDYSRDLVACLTMSFLASISAIRASDKSSGRTSEPKKSETNRWLGLPPP